MGQPHERVPMIPTANPDSDTPHLMPNEEPVLVLQGGGALGAYQADVHDALAAARLEPVCVADILTQKKST